MPFEEGYTLRTQNLSMATMLLSTYNTLCGTLSDLLAPAVLIDTARTRTPS